MVTVKKKNAPQPLHQQAAKPRKGNGDASRHVAKAHVADLGSATDCAYTEQADPLLLDPACGVGEGQRASLMARGKDLLAGEAAGVATAAAIVVGAALIEVELIPGLIIGAGAILLGKLFPELGGYVRPAVKSAVRAGFSMSQKAREVMAEASEQVHDLVAEVKHEQGQQPPMTKVSRAPGKVQTATGVPVH